MSEGARSDEIQHLVLSIADERRAVKEKEKRESWTEYVSLMVVVLAVATGVGSLEAGGFSSRVMLFQAKASDEWAYYQSESVKQRIAEMEARQSTGPQAEAAQADVARDKKDQLDAQTRAKPSRISATPTPSTAPTWGTASRCSRSRSRSRRRAC